MGEASDDYGECLVSCPPLATATMAATIPDGSTDIVVEICRSNRCSKALVDLTAELRPKPDFPNQGTDHFRPRGEAEGATIVLAWRDAHAMLFSVEFAGYTPPSGSEPFSLTVENHTGWSASGEGTMHYRYGSHACMECWSGTLELTPTYSDR